MRANLKFTFISILILLFMQSWVAYGQTQKTVNCSFTIPQVALVDVEPSGTSNISLTLTVNPESGLPVSATGATNNSLWINYSSCVPTGKTRNLTAHVSSGTIPGGIQILLSSAAYSGTGGAGTYGTSSGTVALSSNPQTLISGIGGCYTGNGSNKGHRLSYSINVSDYQNLKHNQSATLQIAFTLTDSN